MIRLKIQPYLQISVASLFFLSTLLLGMGQRSFFYPLFAGLVAVTSVILVDIKQRFSLDQHWSRRWAMVVVGLLLFQMFRNVEQSQLLNVANILVFLQAILLFQKKTKLVYWELISLTMLQVAVAAALNLGFMFGVLLIGYMFVGILTLALFYVYREIESVESDRTIDRSKVGQLNWHHHEDVSGFVIEKSFLGRLCWLALISVLGSVLLFFAIPRFNNQVWRNQEAEQLSSVGFTEEVELNDLDEILENPEEVMRVEFTRLDRQPYVFTNEPYFRGTVLSDFNSSKEVWRQRQFIEERRDFAGIRTSDLSSVVVQKTTLQPGRHSVLFNVAPCYNLDRNHPPFLLDLHTRQLTLAKERTSLNAPIRYEIATTGLRGQVQTPWIPILNRHVSERDDDGKPVHERDGDGNPVLNRHRYRLLMPFNNSGDDNAYRPIKTLATSIITDSELLDGNSLEKAKNLERYFLNSKEYIYSLKGGQERSRRNKAIVDFVTDHKTGHCEFFASALALMLRSQGIPARLVIGYKGGDYNSVGNFFTVRQLHCHAWVEAYIPPEELPVGAVPAHEDRGNGAWVRLDPTPSRTHIIANTDQMPLLDKAKEVIDYFQVLWDDYVLGLNSQRQQQSIYMPLVTSAQQVGLFIFGKQHWWDRWQWMKLQAHAFVTGRWITGQTIILLAILSPLIYMIRDQIRTMLRSLLKLLPTKSRRLLRTNRGELIYDRLETILGKCGYRRRAMQTQRDFATRVTSDLEEQGFSNEMILVPPRIAAAFYRVRFGSHTLTGPEIQHLEDSLRTFERDLTDKSKVRMTHERRTSAGR